MNSSLSKIRSVLDPSSIELVLNLRNYTAPGLHSLKYTSSSWVLLPSRFVASLLVVLVWPLTISKGGLKFFQNEFNATGAQA